MSWIEEADQPDLPEIFRVLSLNSQALDVVRALNEGLVFGNSTLSRVQEEAIATAVSVANHCRYGALTHAGFLRRCSGNPELASQILNDHTTADFSEQDRRMLDFAVRITLDHSGLTQREVDRQKAAGFKDKDIVSVVLVLQRRFKEGCAGRHEVRRGAWHGSAWPVRYYPASLPATAATQPARTVPWATIPAPPGRPAAS